MALVPWPCGHGILRRGILSPMIRSTADRLRLAIPCVACLLVAPTAASCGARSGLLDARRSHAPDAGLDASTVPGDGGPTSDVVSPDAAPALTCRLVPAGDPASIVAMPDRHATAPSMVALTPGNEAEPARVALQFMASGGSSTLHPDTQVARVRIGAAWPGGVFLDRDPTLVGIEAHGWAEMVRAPGGSDELGFAWHGDPGGTSRTMFRPFDLGAWTPGPSVDVSTTGEAALSLAAGKGTGAFGAGWDGEGYAVVWREYEPVEGEWPVGPAVAVLDTEGNILIGPHRVAAPTEYPGRAPRVVWSGSTYVMATAFVDCPEGDDLCSPASVVVTRVRPASGDAYDDSGVDLVAVIPAAEPGTVPRRPYVAAHEGRVYAAWAEGVLDDPENRRAVRVVELDATGAPTGNDSVAAADVPLDLGVTLTVGELGVVVVWGENGDASLSSGELGRSRLAARRFDLDLNPMNEKVVMQASRFNGYGWPWAVTLSEPRSVLLSWSASAIGEDYGPDEVFLGRFDCVNPVEADGGVDAGHDGATGAVEYGAAMGPIGALDRFVVFRKDFGTDTCMRIGLAAPMDPFLYDVEVTEPYAVEHAAVTQGAQKCDGPLWGENAVHATEAHGKVEITLSDETWMPCDVSADVQLSFGSDAPTWVPGVVDFEAAGLEVAGGCDP